MSPKLKVILVLLLAGVLPSALGLYRGLVFGETEYVQVAAHEAIEMVNTCIALGVAMLLFLRIRHQTSARHLLWVAAGLVTMGFLNGMHGLALFGDTWAWLRHSTTFLGGVLFALVWVPFPKWLIRYAFLFIMAVAALTILLGASIWAWAELMPAAWKPTGGYTFAGKALNLLGGLGFLVAAVYFFRRYLCQPKVEDLAFAGQTLLFGTSALLLGYSRVWTPEYWFWHGVRLVAYSILLVVAYEMIVKLYQEQRRQAEALKTTNMQLRRMVEELEYFSYTITHDMRAPLRAMEGFGAILMKECAGCLHPDRQEFLRRIVEGSARMDHLITDALNYSKIVQTELDLEPVDAGKKLRGMVESYPAFQAPKARVIIEENIPVVLANPAGLTQCFSNLLSNAVKFVQPGKIPTVRIWGERNGEYARIWFEDNGIGIAKEYQEQIWIMFQKLDKSYEGTGIGLALVRKVVERMQGKVGVESEEGKGSRFWVELKIPARAN